MKPLIEEEYRCTCGKLLFKGYIMSGALETKCPRCHALTTLGDSMSEPGRYAFLLDRDAKIVNATHTASEVLGYPMIVLIGMHYDDISVAMNRALYTKVFEVLMKQSVKKIHYQHGMQVKSDGSAMPVDVRFRMITTHDGPSILCICNPRLSQAEGIETFGTHIANVCDGYAEIDPERIFTVVNDQFKDLLGHEQADMVGRPISDFLYDTHDSETHRIRAERIKAQFDARVPFRVKDSVLKHKDGHAVNCEFYFMPTFDESVEFCGYRILVWLVA